MNTPHGMKQQAWLYSVGTFVAQLITMATAILSRRFLGPMQMGIWSTLQIVIDYSKYSTLGVLTAVAREIPYLIGKGEQKTADETKNLAFSFVTVSSLVLSAGIVLFAAIMGRHFSLEVVRGLYLVALVIFLQRMNNLLIALLRCYKQFHVESGMMILSALINAFLVAVMAYYYKIYGFIAAMILSYLFNIGYLTRVYRFAFHWFYSAKMLRPLITFGLPLIFIGALAAVLRSIDKIMVVRMLGFEQMGLYSVAIMVTSYMSNFSTAVAIVISPHMQEKFGIKDNPIDLLETLRKSSNLFTFGMPLMILAASFFAPDLISLFLPKFEGGIPAMRILILNIFFAALAQPYQDALVAMKKHWLLFPILGGSVFFGALLNWIVIRAGYGIVGVATMTIVTFFLCFSLSYFVVISKLMNFSRAIKDYTLYMGCFFYLLTSIKSADVLVGQFGDLAWVRFCIHAGVAVFFSSPLLFQLNRQFGLWRVIMKRLSLRPQTGSI